MYSEQRLPYPPACWEISVLLGRYILRVTPHTSLELGAVADLMLMLEHAARLSEFPSMPISISEVSRLWEQYLTCDVDHLPSVGKNALQQLMNSCNAGWSTLPVSFHREAIGSTTTPKTIPNPTRLPVPFTVTSTGVAGTSGYVVLYALSMFPYKRNRLR